MQQIITFLTDMGTKDPYLASLNLNYFNHFPALKILHLSHDIESYDRLQAAYYLRYLYADFPKNTIHVVNVGNANRYLYTEFLIQ